MNEELLPIVDESGRTVGSAQRCVCHDGISHLLHPVVHLHIISQRGDKVLLQKRSMRKEIQPGRWDTSVGGHVDYGETVPQALMREAREELGIDASGATFAGSYVWASEREHELVNIYLLRADASVRPHHDTTSREWAPADTAALCIDFDPAEIDDVRFWDIDQLRAACERGELTPNFEQEFFSRILPQFILA